MGIVQRLFDAFRRALRPAPSAPSAERLPPRGAGPEEDASRTPTTMPPVTAIAESPHDAEPAPADPPRMDRQSEAVEAFVASVEHLPLFSSTATQLIRSVDRDDVTVGELTRLISTDGALVAHLLRIVNSPYYGLSHRLGTVSEALSVLGVNLIRRTITAAVLQRPLLAYLHDTTAVRAFWRHELTCAALARHLAAQKGLDGEIAYMAGLMHDVGRLAMLMQFPTQSDVLLRVRADDDTFGIEQEFSRFGFDHAQVGGALLDLWGLPPRIVQAAQQHADETEPADPFCACIWRANLLSHEMIDEPDDEQMQLPWMVAIGLTTKARRQIHDEIRALESDAG